MSEKENKTILLTGVAGFIGMHTSERLLESGYTLVGIDNLNDYYDVQLKKDRLKRLEKYAKFHFLEADIVNKDLLHQIFKKYDPSFVLHLAAQAGVRYSITNPHAYIDANVQGFLNILEGCRSQKVEHLESMF